jgi:xanthine dehydrogenase YagT iron-sulfur-binding subunit
MRHKDPQQVTRREFVTAVGGVTGALALGVPILDTTQVTTVAAGPAADQRLEPASLVINGRKHTFQLDPRVTLLDLLRENLGLTGTKKGCDHGQCGACTVLANGVRINSCLALAVSLDGEEITTVEGIAQGSDLHPVQAAFVEHDGLQCGYCTPGQICSAVALLHEARRGDASIVMKDLSKSGPVDLTDDDIRERMSGNICRCGAYPGIVAAVRSAWRQNIPPLSAGGRP